MKVFEICFSPTGGTKKVADILANRFSDTVLPVDLTEANANFSGILLHEEDVVILAVPSFGGRAPAPAIERLSKIQGNGAKAVLVCVYGNRAYEDTLSELSDTAKKAGFQIVAAIAAIAEHSIARQFAAGRPDKQDVEQLTQFAQRIQKKLDDKNMSEPAIPGNRPYKKAGKSGIVPKPTKHCVQCGLCAAKCPVQAIDANDPKKVDKKKCISCMRCVAVCPHDAREINGLLLTAVGTALKKPCSVRKACELYL